MDLQLKGKKVLITGATKGIGRSIAELFAAEGADVGICARSKGPVADAIKALKRHGGTVWGQALDVGDGAAMEAWIAEGAKALGGIDVLVLNASGLAENVTPLEFRKGFDVDVMHTVNGVTAAMPHLERSKAASIIAIASISGVEDYGYSEAAYGAMKAALLFYMKSLAGMVAAKGIRANIVSPGPIQFPGGFWEDIENRQPDVHRDVRAKNPMGRLGKPEEIAHAVAFLASPLASYINGSNLVVDGGHTKRVQN